MLSSIGILSKALRLRVGKVEIGELGVLVLGVNNYILSPPLPIPPTPYTLLATPKDVAWVTNCALNMIFVLMWLNLYLLANKRYG